jgi:methyl-accepting chemotaxis protein
MVTKLFSRLRLSQKIMIVGGLAAFLPFLIGLILMLTSSNTLTAKISGELRKNCENQLSTVTKEMLTICDTHHQKLLQTIATNLKVAQEILGQQGGLRLQAKKAWKWEAKNQVSSQITDVKLPQAMLGKTVLKANSDPAVYSPVVDEVSKLVGGTCTIFQRMDREGDMLRIATNVINKENRRAIGTYIPAMNPDGTENKVIAKVLRGETFTGRAKVLDKWYTTSYKPLTDSKSGGVIGMLFVGVEEGSDAVLKKTFTSIQVGEGGYVYVLGGTGEQMGQYIISRNGERDGENILEARDASGRYFIKEMIDNAKKNGSGNISFIRYPWQNKNEKQASYKYASVSYFEPWDWVVASSIGEEELLSQLNHIKANFASTAMMLIIGSIASFLIALGLSWYCGQFIANPVNDMCKVAKALSEGDVSKKIEYESRDEIGALADSFRMMVDYIKESTDHAKAISRGDLSRSIVEHSENDTLSQSFIQLNKAVSSMKTDVNSLISGAIDGRLSVRADVSKHEGDYRAIVEGINNTLDAFTGPINLAAGYIDRIACGDIPERITDTFNGDFNILVGNLNTLIDTIKSMGGDIRTICIASYEGQFDTRVDPSKYKGLYSKIMKGMNDIMASLTSTIRMAAEKLSLISRGEIPAKITEDYRGDFNQIKDDINRCIDAIQSMLSDVNMLSQSALDGNLQLRADASRHQGDFRKIVQGVNDTLDAVVGPLYMAAHYIDSLAKGDIPDAITEEYKGEFNVLITNINTLIKTIKDIASGIRTICIASYEGQFDTRLDPSKFSGHYSKIIAGMNDMMTNLTSAITLASRNLALISRGEIPPLLTEEYRGDFNKIRDDLNRCINAINMMLTDVNTLSKSAVEGNLQVRANSDQHSGDFRKIVAGVNETLDSVVKPINEIAAVMERIAEKDLSARIKGEYRGDFAKMKASINTAVDNLDSSMDQVSASSGHVSAAASEIGTGSQSLAHGASEQASAIEEISSSLQEVASKVEESASHALGAKEMTDQARIITKRGVESMNRLSDAIKVIKQSADHTAKIVKTIDEIAFQTNLLALNAAVEAARAGEAGKGFAVVAEEVRNLAMRSAEAAKNTANMIEESSKNAENGVVLNVEVLKNLEEIARQVVKISDVMGEIAQSSDKQKLGIKTVNASLEQMNHLTQMNAANSEQSAAAAEELDTQAKEMNELVSTFKLSRDLAYGGRVRRPDESARQEDEYFAVMK